MRAWQDGGNIRRLSNLVSLKGMNLAVAAPVITGPRDDIPNVVNAS